MWGECIDFMRWYHKLYSMALLPVMAIQDEDLPLTVTLGSLFIDFVNHVGRNRRETCRNLQTTLTQKLEQHEHEDRKYQTPFIHMTKYEILKCM